MSRILNCQIEDDGDVVRLHFDSGVEARFHALWLRDNALDAKTRDPRNGQRLLTLAQMPAQARVTDSRVDGESVTLAFAPEGKRFTWSASWLLAHNYDTGQHDADHGREQGWLPPGIRRWDATLDAGITVARFSALRDDQNALHQWLAHVRDLGFALMRDGPTTSGAVIELAERFGYVRETNYGRWFDVRAEVNPSNLAFTGLPLQAHTDNPYRDPVPTLQILYCLENSAAGGESLIVDGFEIARRLQQASPRAFDLLSRYCARFAYVGSEGVELHAKKPMIELAADLELVAVRFNNRSAAPVVDVPFAQMPAYYEAYRAFAALVDDPALAVTFKLAPGEAFIVDNTRVLHARTGYAGAGSRWLQGCYADKDGLRSTLAVLERTLRNQARPSPGVWQSGAARSP